MHEGLCMIQPFLYMYICHINIWQSYYIYTAIYLYVVQVKTQHTEFNK